MKIKRTFWAAAIVFLAAAISSCQQRQECCSAEELVPGEQAPLANPGDRGFGMPSTSSQSTRPSRNTKPEIRTVHIDSLSMSDPFILADDATHKYYLTSSGGSIYTSEDLKMWTGPYQAYDVSGTWMEGSRFVAAAEMHKINGKYYYIATFTDKSKLVDVVPRRYNVYRQQSQILVSDTAIGPYKPLNEDPGFCVLPENWAILDGTLWNEGGKTYMVFVHEWLQVIDGTMDYVVLSDDLTHAVTKPKTLFRASEAKWSKEMNGNNEATYGMRIPGWVTDGPQLFRTGTGRLGMIWSSWGEHRYAEGVAYSESGTIDGPWIQQDEPLKGDNSGHGMLFNTFEGKPLLVIHHSEGDGPRKPQLWNIDLSGDSLVIGNRYRP